jgi:hypothetical protein
VANYDGTVSKLDLVSGAEVSRYKVGLWGDECDSPSRTAVDGAGNAYVASRAHMCDRSQGSVTKMAGDASFCIDRNRNDVIDTSTGPTPLPLNTDECVIWTARVGGPAAIPRGVAIDLGDELHPRGYPWVGTYTEMRAYKLDPGSGEVLDTVALNVNAYGLAADGLGGIWVSGRGPDSGYIQRFDASSGEVEPRISWSRSGCGGMVYGIAVDRLNRVWVADYDSFAGCAARWDPAAGTWLTVRAGGMGGGGRGIAVAADGRVWMALNGPDQMLSWNGEDGSDVTAHAIAGGGTPVGIGLDDLGHVWTVNQSTNDVTRLDLLSGDTERFPVGTQPYTYSDFTGYQRRVVAVDGMWTKTWERCAVSPEDHWGVFSWDVTAPPGEISLTAQSADSLADLDAARLVSLAVVPSDLPPVDVEAAFAEAGVATGRYLRVNVMLRADSRGTSPVFRSVSLRWHCNDFG